MGTEQVIEEFEEEIEKRFRLRLDPRLLHRIETLVAAPEFGFASVDHFLTAAIYSFVSFKEKTLRRMGGERW